MPPGRPKRDPQDPATQATAFEERRLELARAAFEIVAEQGIERLRTRDVADRVSVNVATLHYYFATKEKLIEGVALYLANQFQTVRASAGVDAKATASDRLEQEFADSRLYFDERPDLIVVMQELVLRARRDPAVAKIVDPLKFYWKASVEETIALGAQEGVFRANPTPQSAAAVIVAALWGAATLPLGSVEREHLYEAIGQWLAAPKPPQP